MKDLENFLDHDDMMSDGIDDNGEDTICQQNRRKEEISAIKWLGTYKDSEHGLNQTRGGQMRSTIINLMEASTKKSRKRWRNVYMPAFREFYQKYRHINAPFSHPQLGSLVTNFCSGVILIPPKFETDINSACGRRRGIEQPSAEGLIKN